MSELSQQAISDLTWFLKRTKGLFEAVDGLESLVSLDQTINERRTQILNMDIDIQNRIDQKKRLDVEIAEADLKVERILAQAKTDYDALIAQGEKEKAHIIAITRDELALEVADMTAQLESLKTQKAEAEHLLWQVARELTAQQDKLANVEAQLEAFRRSI